MNRDGEWMTVLEHPVGETWLCDDCVYNTFTGIADDTCYCRMQWPHGGVEGRLIFKHKDCVLYTQSYGKRKR